jgi:hypothetical protein
MTDTLLFNMVPTITVALVSQNQLFSSLLMEVCVPHLQTPYHKCLHTIITFKSVAAKMILYSRQLLGAR